MNKIEQLLKEDFVLELFNEKVLPLYDYFSSIKKIEIKSYKKNIWKNTYHVVFEYTTHFQTEDGKIVSIPIFCSAHSEEPRKNVYTALKYLWDKGFSSDHLTIPRPLFYSDEFRGIFYRGVEGKNLYRYIRVGDKKEIEKIIPMASEWFMKLHDLPVETAINFNKENSRIRTVIPGKDGLFNSLKERYPEHLDFYSYVYDYFIKNEEEFLNSTKKRWLVHGDAHPENIIKINDNKLGVIDFTDLSLTDFTRDLGTFLQQVEFMIMRKMNDQVYANKIKDLFLEEYFKNAKIEIDNKLQRRIDNYYYWTAIRTATFFLLKDKSEPERGEELIKKVKVNLRVG